MSELNQNPSPSEEAAAPKAEKAAAPAAPLSEDTIRIYAALSYVGPLFLVPLTLAKDSAFAKFHARQGLVLFIVEVLASFTAWIPIISWLLSVACLGLSIYAFIRTMKGDKWEIPVIGQLAKKINL